MKRIVLVAFALFLTGQAKPAIEKSDPNWWRHGVFYQIYPRSFKDSDNDGIGDLQGIISKLEHLRDAGVTATWLSPIFKSPQVDQGYDISNYTEIQPEYGTTKDFEELAAKAKKMGIKVILDFVPNHSSDQSDWFIKSEQRIDPYTDYYVWADPDEATGGPPNNWISNFRYSAWKFSKIRKQYYYHEFAAAQPDLNYKSPELVQEMKDILTFWLDRGVDGFRIDAVPFLFEEGLEDEPLSGDPVATPDDWNYLSHIYTMDQPGTFDMIYQWREHLDEYTATHGGDDRIMMTEAYTDIKHTMLYYGDGNGRKGAHFTFNFNFITDLTKNSTAQNILDAINKWMDNLPDGAAANWVLGNHDNHRAASRLGQENVDGFNMLVMVLPNVAVTYNGEEIGMPDGEVTFEQGQDPGACNSPPQDFGRLSRDFERTPFQWNNSTNAGFNEGATPWLPVASHYKEINLKAQSSPGARSHFHTYQNLVKLRNREAFVNGNLNCRVISQNVFALTRELPKGDNYLFVFNMGDEPTTVDLSVFKALKPKLELAVGSINSPRNIGDQVNTANMLLNPHESLVLVSRM